MSIHSPRKATTKADVPARHGGVVNESCGARRYVSQIKGSFVLVLLLLLLVALEPLPAAQVQPIDLSKAARASRIEDPAKATRAYLEAVPAERRVKTKAYATGNYILDVVDVLISVAILIALLALGISSKMKAAAQHFTRFRSVQHALYWTQFLILTTLIAFPLTVYRSYFREKAYGLLTQPFPGWLWDQVKGLLLGCIFGAILIVLLYAVLRRTPRTWWIWGSAVMIGFLIITAAIAPVFIMPLFNKFTPIKNQEIRESILAMAHRHNIPADEVYEMDASRRTDRISAFVNGALGTTRIVMFDNTLRRCTPQEIRMIMGHEMGHYVLNHVWKHIAFFSVVILLGFLFVRWAFGKTVSRYPSWGVEGVADIAGLPLFLLLLSVFLFVTSPITNTWSRLLEDHADDFGLQASREPDAAATTFLKLGEYRDLDPHPVIEFLLFDHPSGRYRIRNAMEWKKQNGTFPGAPDLLISP